VTFTVGDRQLAIWNREMREVVEPGPVIVSAGNSAANLKSTELTIA
jgi:beta-glucosidase